VIWLVATYFNKHLFGNDLPHWLQEKLEGDLVGVVVAGVGDGADVESCGGDERVEWLVVEEAAEVRTSPRNQEPRFS
jgi:hypothetical protein